jgi:hypothetical protein
MVDMSSDDEPSAEQVPGPGPRPRRGRRISVAAAAAIVVLLIGGTVAWATGDDEPSAAGSTPQEEHRGRTQPDHEHGHPHGRRSDRPPYAERYRAATAPQRAAADALVADVTATLAAYPDVDAAVAAGYQQPRGRSARGRMYHYLNPAFVTDGRTLDPARPEGLVFADGAGDGDATGDGAPVLVGAFFVAPAGAEAPAPAGDLVVWHSHDDACPALFVSDDEPCLDSRRMLHVWTAGEITLAGRRPDRATTVRVVDPFGTPFDAAVERAPR